jgi:hypothetical protein
MATIIRKELLMLNDVNIVLWDIETLPHIGLHWGMWKQNIQGYAIAQQSAMFCISYKWLHSKRIHNISASDVSGWQKDPYAHERYLAESFIPILESADFAVAHNGDGFDYKKLKAVSVMQNLKPFRARTVDTLKMARRAGMFPKGNKLDNLAEVLGLAKKSPMGFNDWKQIALYGSTKHADKMNKYCNQDVQVLEDVFLRLWPHTESVLPNIAALGGKGPDAVACDRCGSEDFVKNGTYIKNVLVYQRYMCNHCGAAFLGRKALKVTEGA